MTKRKRREKKVKFPFMETKEGKRAIMLKEMWDTLHKTNSKTTGIPSLDAEIIEKIGDWRNVK